jgi:hypothetical protein
MKINYFNYETISGTTSGGFRIYQAKNGQIHMLMGDRVTALTKKQIDDLFIDVFSLHDFDFDDYKTAYAKV